MKTMLVLSLTLFIFVGCEEEPTTGIPTPQPGKAESYPSWSFAGDRIVFSSMFDSAGEISPGIYISDTLGNSRKPIGPRSVSILNARWLPGDTALVANTTLEGKLGIYNLITDSVRILDGPLRGLIFDVSRDGRFIYYLGPALDTIWTTGIYRYDISDGSVLAINDGENPAISPDGLMLVFDQSTICTRVIADSTENCLSLIGRNPIWSADGRSIIYNNEKGEIHIANLFGNDRFLVEGGGRPSLSPDGLSILFSRVGNDFQTHIWRVNIDGTGLRQVTR